MLVPRFTLGLRTIVFLLVFAVLQVGWESLRGSSVERLVVHEGVVVPAAFLVNVLTPAVGARATGFTLGAPGGGVNVQNGCEGVETLFLLYAAVMAAALQWRHRLQGLLLGTVVVFAVNQARLLLLFYAYRADHALFDPLHATVTPIVMVLLVFAFFYAWVVRFSRDTATTA